MVEGRLRCTVASCAVSEERLCILIFCHVYKSFKKTEEEGKAEQLENGLEGKGLFHYTDCEGRKQKARPRYEEIFNLQYSLKSQEDALIKLKT